MEVESGRSRFQDYSPRGMPTRPAFQLRIPALPHPPALPATARTPSPRPSPRAAAAPASAATHEQQWRQEAQRARPSSGGSSSSSDGRASPRAPRTRSLLPLDVFDPDTERDAAWRRALPKQSRKASRANGEPDNDESCAPVDAAAGVLALSRHYLPGGGVEWAACEVLGHEPDEGLFLIRWSAQRGQKWVMRSNLRMPGEERGGAHAAAWRRRWQSAHELRAEAEAQLRRSEEGRAAVTAPVAAPVVAPLAEVPVAAPLAEAVAPAVAVAVAAAAAAAAAVAAPPPASDAPPVAADAEGEGEGECEYEGGGEGLGRERAPLRPGRIEKLTAYFDRPAQMRDLRREVELRYREVELSLARQQQQPPPEQFGGLGRPGGGAWRAEAPARALPWLRAEEESLLRRQWRYTQRVRASLPRRALVANERLLRLLHKLHELCLRHGEGRLCAPLPAAPVALADFILQQRAALEAGRCALSAEMPRLVAEACLVSLAPELHAAAVGGERFVIDETEWEEGRQGQQGPQVRQGRRSWVDGLDLWRKEVALRHGLDLGAQLTALAPSERSRAREGAGSGNASEVVEVEKEEKEGEEGEEEKEEILG